MRAPTTPTTRPADLPLPGAGLLRAHARSAPAAALASVLMAGLLVWALGASIEPPRHAAWLLTLAAAVALRLLVWAAYRSSAAGAQVPGRWLIAFRTVIALHGLAWGAAAWLPATPSDPAQQAVLATLLIGLAAGAMILTLFDLPAGLLFALPVTVPLALRLLLQPDPLPAASVVALVMAVSVISMVIVSAQQARRARRALQATRRAESERMREAREAQTLLQLVFDHAGQGISVFDADLRLRAWNEQALICTDTAPSVVRAGQPIRELMVHQAQRGLFGPVDSAEAEADRRLARLRSMANGPPSIERVTSTNGRRVEVRRNPLPGGGFVLFHVDITEREASLAALAERQRMLSLVLEATEQGFWFIDNELRTTDVNPAICRMLGVTREQMLGRSIYDFVDEANAEVFREHVKLRELGRSEGYEIALRRSDGSLVHCFNNATPVHDAQGHKVGALGLFSDISAQKQTEAQLRQASDLLAQKSQVLEATFDSLAQGVLSVDAHGRCNAWNRRFLELLQIPESVMQARPLLSELRRYQVEQGHFGPQLERMDETGRDNLQRFLRGEPDTLAERFQRTRADGRVLEVASHFAADGALVRTYTDVTERQAAEAALIAARDEAERANRAKSEFLSRMSHELRTPMNAILGFGQLLEADPDEPLSPRQAERVQALLRGGRHLLVLINEVLDIARIEAGTLQLQLQPVDVAALARDALGLVQPVAQARGVSLRLDDSAAGLACMAQADPTRLRQVLLNLLSNAIKFNREAGQVRLSCQLEPTAVRLEVADQGPGIPAAQLPRLFQAFERLDVDGAIEGTGIGLALSRSLMALMHGDIGVRSTVGEGSVFWLRLPQLAGATLTGAPDDAAATRGAPDAPARRPVVLYIEDNEVNQMLRPACWRIARRSICASPPTARPAWPWPPPIRPTWCCWTSSYPASTVSR
jgi:PAS domain S-box-containing protein